MKYETSQNLSREEFKRLFGVKRETFAQMMELMQRRFGLRCNLIAAIYNFEVSLPTSKTCSPQS
jgi:hypothetical protein